ncbi:hypothetical protein AAG570_008509 [Ranatra chinensis]|uniref:Uncharacterized protein n=1 Tax=Ranatra chinensis TaxID=642074 RepID=A0ABD0YRE6_9HEMI
MMDILSSRSRRQGLHHQGGRQGDYSHNRQAETIVHTAHRGQQFTTVCNQYTTPKRTLKRWGKGQELTAGARCTKRMPAPGLLKWGETIGIVSHDREAATLISEELGDDMQDAVRKLLDKKREGNGGRSKQDTEEVGKTNRSRQLVAGT